MYGDLLGTIDELETHLLLSFGEFDDIERRSNAAGSNI